MYATIYSNNIEKTVRMLEKRKVKILGIKKLIVIEYSDYSDIENIRNWPTIENVDLNPDDCLCEASNEGEKHGLQRL